MEEEGQERVLEEDGKAEEGGGDGSGGGAGGRWREGSVGHQNLLHLLFGEFAQECCEDPMGVVRICPNRSSSGTLRFTSCSLWGKKLKFALI